MVLKHGLLQWQNYRNTAYWNIMVLKHGLFEYYSLETWLTGNFG